MTKMKKIAAVLTLTAVTGVAGLIHAADIRNPADMLSALTGKTAQQVQDDRAAGKSYGAQAAEAGKLEAFQDEWLAQRKAVLDQQVRDGRITQAQADAALKAMEDRQALCNGTGSGAGCSTAAGAGCGMSGTAAGRGMMGGGRGMMGGAWR